MTEVTHSIYTLHLSMKKIFAALLMITCGLGGFVHAQQQRTSYTGNPKWQSNQYVWYYNSANAPSYVIGYDSYVKDLINYLNVIEQECDIDFKYAGTTTRTKSQDNVNVLGWGVISGTGVTTSAWNGSMYYYDADVVITTSQTLKLRDLLGVVKHEFLHAIGFTHTTEIYSAMVYPYMDGQWLRPNYEYDIKECKRLYGARTHRTQFTPQITYSGSTIDMTVQVTADDIDLGTTRNVYVLAVFQGMLFEQTTSGWQQVNDTNNLTPYKTIDSIEKTTNVKVLNDFNYTWLTGTGTQVYVGFANNTSDLMKYAQYKMMVEF